MDPGTSRSPRRKNINATIKDAAIASQQKAARLAERVNELKENNARLGSRVLELLAEIKRLEDIGSCNHETAIEYQNEARDLQRRLCEYEGHLPIGWTDDVWCELCGENLITGNISDD